MTRAGSRPKSRAVAEDQNLELNHKKDRLLNSVSVGSKNLGAQKSKLDLFRVEIRKPE